MEVDIKNRVTRSDMRAVSNLVEDTCCEPGCGASIMVDRFQKEQGHASQCVACIIRGKIAKGEVR